MTTWTMQPTKSGVGGAGGAIEKAPAGNHPAVLVAIIDLGHQLRQFDDDGKWQHRIYLVWELVTEKQSGGANHVVGALVTMSLHEMATLRKWVEARRAAPIAEGQDFNITEELGKPCLLNIKHSDKGYPRVDGVTAVPKGLPCPPATRKPFALTLDEYRAGTKVPEWIPWLYGKPISDHIGQSRELSGSKPANATPVNNPQPSSPPADKGVPPDDLPEPDPTAKWDFHDGDNWHTGLTTEELQHHFNSGADPAWTYVRPAGASREQTKKGTAFGFKAGDPIPY